MNNPSACEGWGINFEIFFITKINCNMSQAANIIRKPDEKSGLSIDVWDFVYPSQRLYNLKLGYKNRRRMGSYLSISLFKFRAKIAYNLSRYGGITSVNTSKPYYL